MAIAELVRERGDAANRQPLAAARRRRERQARVALLCGFATMAALQVGAALIVNLWRPDIIDPTYGDRVASLRAATRARGTHTVVMVGSSRTYVGLQPGPLSAALTAELGSPVSVANAAYAGGGPLTELLFWRRLQRDGLRPDLLMIEVMPAYLVDHWPRAEMGETRLPAYRIGWLDLPLLARYRAGTRPTLYRDVEFTDANILYNRRGSILNAVAARLVPAWPALRDERAGSGFLTVDATPELRQKALNFAREQYQGLASFSFTGRDRSTSALRELLASCRRSGVPTCLVLMPEGPEFRSWYRKGSWPEFQKNIEQFCREEETSLVVAREWLEEDDFLDSHHMLPSGAKKFSLRLGEEAILPRLRQKDNLPRKSLLNRAAAP